MAAYTQASFTDSWYAVEVDQGLKSVEHIGETEASGRRPGGFPLCLFSLVGNKTMCSIPAKLRHGARALAITRYVGEVVSHRRLIVPHRPAE